MFSRLFYNSKCYPNRIGKERLFLALLISFSSVLSLYAFFYLIDEAFRLIDLGFTNLPYTLSEEEKYKSNLLYAGISVSVGNSIFISYLFSKPNKILDRRNLSRRKIMNDQIFLSGNFTHWFLKIGVTFGVFSSCCLNFKDLVFFYPLTLLMLIVLYLEQWKTLLKVLTSAKYKILISHFIITIVAIFGLAKFNVIDYKKIEKTALSHNPEVNLPFSNYEYEENYQYRSPIMIIKLKLNASNELELFTNDRRKFSMLELQNLINEERSALREELTPFLTVMILADKDLKLHYIKELEARLLLSNIRWVDYLLIDNTIPFLNYGIENKSLYHRITSDVLDMKPELFNENIPFPPFPIFKEERFKDSLMVNASNNIKINDINISKELLSEKLKKSINSQTYIKYVYEENITYQDYIDVLSTHHSAVYELRRKEQIVFDKYSSSEAYREDQRRLKQKYPIVIREIFE
jgi:biopolymer transport protein ExbD